MKNFLETHFLRGGAACPQDAGLGTHDRAESALRTTRSTSILLFSASPHLAFFCVFLLFTSAARAQWQNVTYTLQGGWNAIYLHGDATHTTIDTLVAANPEIVSIWRWNTNANPVQFGSSPLIPTAGTSDWNIWYRGNAAGSSLSALIGQNAYLVECSGAATATYSIMIPQKVLTPRSTWVRNGANFLGFPARFNTAYPMFSSYFATFPVATAANTKIYKYTGGPLGEGNPVQVFSPQFEPLNRNQAYWFDAAVVGDFYAPIEISSSNLSGLVFGRTGSQIIVRLRNRTAAAVTLTVTPTDSAPSPTGQEQITAGVPLTQRVYNSTTLTFDTTPVTSAFNVVLGPQASTELTFGVNRALITGATNALYASLLRFTEAGNLIDIALPVSARVTSLSGLWVGDVAVNGVQSTVAGATNPATATSYPLRVLLHVDDSGTARLLSQVFLGRLAPAPYALGICTQESLLKADDKANARRLVAAHLPLDTEVSTGTGSVALGQTLVRAITIPFNERTNPYVHAYHPDHDNKDARSAVLTTPLESPTIARTCSFTFSVAPPAGTSAAGWGSTVLGGTYQETVSGLHRSDLTVTGTFELRRVSEIGSITTN